MLIDRLYLALVANKYFCVPSILKRFLLVSENNHYYINTQSLKREVQNAPRTVVY